VGDCRHGKGSEAGCHGGELSCAQAMEFARNHKVPLKKMKYLTDFFKIRLKSCQLGCF
jgi:hypothetical protein